MAAHILDQIKDFISSDRTSAKMKSGVVELYLRKSNRQIGGQYYNCIDIAEIIVEYEYQGRGYGTNVINAVHDLSPFPFQVTYIECIANPHLIRWCEKNGWEKQEGVADTNYYKMK